ncbi:galactokinase family protein [Paludicola sp. MB14-C6]|uniref:galactokinase n=1 Tax=Paludihabitans sp. MB14-C6 TaxID=3070656 RepID=UPI0027DE04F4|nr:galactokinase family protein [Paludicola sp. MB14-C6]WMJ22604.1 galactokinase family protein [Paludicola sp. MB14-C6]
MNIEQLKDSIVSGAYNSVLQNIYSDNINTVKARYLSCIEGYQQQFQKGDNISVFSAPGRTEVGGNHTDHQHGRVIAGAVDLDIIAVVNKTNANVIRVFSEGFGLTEVVLDNFNVVENEKETSAALIRGIVSRLKERGYPVSGFDAYTMSDVLCGSGLSSSAAFEVLIGTVLNDLYCNSELKAIEIAQIAQYAENVYFGKPSGLMDQTASAVGGFVSIDFACIKKPIINPITFDLKKHGYQLVIVNTGANHSDLTDDYASIPHEMKDIASCFDKEHLNEVETTVFYQNIPKLRGQVSDRAILRAIHFFEDTNRVTRQADALIHQDIDTFLKEVNASGQSSYDYLQNVYSPHNPTEQSIALALCLTKQFLKGQGACRVHGGGFAGTIQVYLPISVTDDYIKHMKLVFGENCCYRINIRKQGGVKVI